ncbi:hypothetical protein ACFYY8_26480 [Streptosporangium sp. NPDC001559]|uniref:hypothetical protein n=1 Tax=Streptosporangium sp. NPDC001559 TaxID=3366187 RepID=UPI0036E6C680
MTVITEPRPPAEARKAARQVVKNSNDHGGDQEGGKQQDAQDDHRADGLVAEPEIDLSTGDPGQRGLDCFVG